MKLFQSLVRQFYLPAQDRLANQIGCRLLFRYLPHYYLQGIVRCDMTRTWKRAGLDIAKGQNHFTIGRVVDGVSSRFDPSSIAYQSWLGGYTVKLDSGQTWSVEDYCRLAIADQNSWLNWFGDPNPFTSVDSWEYEEVGKFAVRGGYVGTLYEGGFSSHSDVGPNIRTPRFYFVSHSLATLYNLANPRLSLTAETLTPRSNGFPYHEISGKVYLVVIDVKPRVKAVLYGNGIFRQSIPTNTFDVLKAEFIRTMKSCDIVET